MSRLSPGARMAIDYALLVATLLASVGLAIVACVMAGKVG